MNDLALLLPAVAQHAGEIKERGGLNGKEIKTAVDLVPMLAIEGDVLLYGGGRPKQQSDLFNRTAHAIAVLALLPGGVELFGHHFEF